MSIQINSENAATYWDLPYIKATHTENMLSVWRMIANEKPDYKHLLEWLKYLGTRSINPRRHEVRKQYMWFLRLSLETGQHCLPFTEPIPHPLPDLQTYLEKNLGAKTEYTSLIEKLIDQTVGEVKAFSNGDKLKRNVSIPLELMSNPAILSSASKIYEQQILEKAEKQFLKEINETEAKSTREEDKDELGYSERVSDKINIELNLLPKTDLTKTFRNPIKCNYYSTETLNFYKRSTIVNHSNNNSNKLRQDERKYKDHTLNNNLAEYKKLMNLTNRNVVRKTLAKEEEKNKIQKESSKTAKNKLKENHRNELDNGTIFSNVLTPLTKKVSDGICLNDLLKGYDVSLTEPKFKYKSNLTK